MSGNNPPSAGSDKTQQQPASRTLLPSPFAHAVSFATRSSCFAIKLGTTAGSLSLDAAKFTTLSSLELARGVVEGVLSRAGKDTLTRSGSHLAKESAESVIERSLEGLHQAVTHAVFWTTAGFRLTSTTISMASGMSQLFLSSLDQLFGSTDSSRAIASIVTLIRRELNDSVPGCRGEKVGVIDLVLGLCAVAYLQGRSWRSQVERLRRQEYEEIIWDVVVLDDGERIDVRGEMTATRAVETHQSPSAVQGKQVPSDQQHMMDLYDGDAVIQHFKEQVASSLPPDTTVSISNAVSTQRTITIDVDGPEPCIIPALPGAEVVETSILPSSRATTGGNPNDKSLATYRVVYKVEHNTVTNTSISHDLASSSESLADSPNIIVETALAAVPGEEDDHANEHTATAKTLPPIPSQSTISIGDDENENGPVPSQESTTQQIDSQTRLNDLVEDSQRLENQQRTPSSTTLQESINSSNKENSNEANQKRTRTPLDAADRRRSASSGNNKKVLTKRKNEATPPPGKNPAKKNSLKKAIKGGSQSFANIWHKDNAVPSSSTTRLEHIGTPDISNRTIISSPRNLRTPPNPLASPPPRFDANGAKSSSPRTSWVSIRERRSDSLVSQTDTYSFPSSSGHRPPSSGVGWVEEKSEQNHVSSVVDDSNTTGTLLAPPSPLRGRRRATSYVPSFYSLGANDSQGSLVLASYYQKSVYNGPDALGALRRTGTLDGIFPNAHLLQNITRYMRFSSASYGSNFLKLMGISKEIPPIHPLDGVHADVRHFVHHTESHTGNILLASFIDPEGGTDSSGSTGRGVPLVHYISLDHEARAVVFACRGTLGFEDVLADMACDYDTLLWRGKGFKVHKGVHASARRLLQSGDGRVMLTLREALAEFPDYGLILCGHSLGGAVTSLLGIMLAEPNPTGTGFVTAKDPSSDQQPFVGAGQSQYPTPRYSLPVGRRIHVYAYGSPGTMSPSLRKRTRGLITSVIHGNDVVPYLSLGVLHDFQTVAVAFKNDQQQAMVGIRQKLWQALQSGVMDKWYRDASTSSIEDDMEWVLSTLQKLRSNMSNQKLVPPGEVFTIETQRVLRRDAFVPLDEANMGKPAQRVVLKYVKDVEAHFKEMRFGTSMLIDHSPAKYEEALNKLRVGVAN